MFPRGEDKVQIHIYRIKNKGSNDYDLKIEQKIPAITMMQPKNGFERGVLDTYNHCRTQELHKYFSMISDKDISYLLNDNYLQ